MSDTPKEVWLIWEGGLVTAWDDEKSPSRKAKHYILNDGTLRETVECVFCKGYGEMSDEQDTPPWECLFCNGTGKRVKP